MTPEAAIGVLESINAKTDYLLITDDARSEALDMAISALQAREAKYSTESSLTQKGLDTISLQPTCNQLATDTISRQAIINSFRYDDDGTAWDMDDIVYRLEQFPSAQPDPCEDAISRKSILDKISKKDNWEKYDRYNIGLSDARQIVQDEPSVTPKRKTGKWIYKDDLKQFFCSECGFPSLTYDDVYIYGMDLSNYCEDCGAEMEVVE